MSQNIPQEATKLKKLTKICDTGISKWSNSKIQIIILATFCYNCIYFMKPHHCAIVSDEGQDIKGQVSGEIRHTHGICAVWEPNEQEIR